MLHPAPRPDPAPDFGAAVRAARRLAGASGRTVCLRVGGAVAEGRGLALFESARQSGEPGFYWRDPATGRVAAAIGALDEGEGLPICDPDALPGPVRVFGRAFAAGPAPADSPWGDWPRSTLRLPAAVMHDGPGGDGGLCILHAAIAPRGDDGADAAALHTRWRALGRLTGGPLERGEPAGEPPVDEEPADRWRARVAAIVEACHHGSLNKVVPARATRFRAPAGARFDAAATLAALGAAHPGATVFGFSHGPRTFVGATPELLARLDGRRLETHALAGTAPRGADRAADDRLGAALLDRDKDRREHRLVVDAITAALDPVAEAVMVDGAPHLRRLPGLQHLETAISARLIPGVGLLDVVDRLHPTPALGGEPRAAALAWLARTEPLDRGWYGGPVGWLDADGAGVAAVAIRSALLTDARAWAFAGAGVVAGSDPEAEWRESALKLQTVGRALRVRPRGRRGDLR